VKVDTYACDVCQTQKKDTNHWWLMWIREVDEPRFEVPAMELTPWNTSALDKAAIHLCGEACVAKKVSEFLNAKS
jgi:hypothetical protein